MSSYDVIVVGGGPGGLSAALLLGRARRRVAVIDAGQPRNAPATHLHGYLTRDGTPPARLLSAGRDEVAHYGGTLIDAKVNTIAGCVGAFTVTLHTGEMLTGRRLLIATGLTDRLPDIPGLAERWGRDVLHCPYCHGHEVADRPLAVLNPGPRAIHQAITIRHWSPHITLLTHGTTPGRDDLATLATNDIEVATAAVTRAVLRDDRLVGLELQDGRLVAAHALFVASDHEPNDRLLGPLGVATAEQPTGRFVTTDAAGRTSVDGIWAVGNLTDPTAQLITSAGDGSRAAIDINSDLITVDAAARAHASRGLP